MKVAFVTREGFRERQQFLYAFAHVAAAFPGAAIVAAAPPKRPSRGASLRRLRRKLATLGPAYALEVVTGLAFQRWFERRDAREIAERMRALPRPEGTVPAASVHGAAALNAPSTGELIRALGVDVLIQSGAGILRPVVFQAPRIATLNMHHGIAPEIRGMSSLHWAQWEGRADWLGTTIHRIDEGIDTGEVLAWARVPPVPGERYAGLYVRATEAGVRALVECLQRLDRGERWRLEAPGPGVYRSTMSGWRRLLLAAGRRPGKGRRG